MRFCFEPMKMLALALVWMSLASAFGADGVGPVKVIFDTDMCQDCDDVGALAVLNKLADGGKAEILACVVNGHDKDKAVAASISAINTYYGRPNIPIGTYQGVGHPATGSPYTARLRDEFPHSAKPDDQEPRALDIYRRTLAAAPDGGVTIISVGFLVNLRDLLESKPDAISPLAGIDLVRQKVKKLVAMGGYFPAGGAECNFASGGGIPDTVYVLAHWPTPILVSGGEIGSGIWTGKGLAAAPKTNPVRRAYEIYTSFNGRPSWDLTAVMAAVEGPELYWNVSPAGICEIQDDGITRWHAAPGGNCFYLETKVPPNEVAKALDDLLAQLPAKH